MRARSGLIGIPQDNEHPKREVHVEEFRIEWRPVTNGQFFKYYVSQDGEVAVPASWVEIDGEMHVCPLLTLPLNPSRHIL